jgi:hypothetical protein
MQVRGTHAVQIFWLPTDVVEEIMKKWKSVSNPRATSRFSGSTLR